MIKKNLFFMLLALYNSATVQAKNYRQAKVREPQRNISHRDIPVHQEMHTNDFVRHNSVHNMIQPKSYNTSSINKQGLQISGTNAQQMSPWLMYINTQNPSGMNDAAYNSAQSLLTGGAGMSPAGASSSAMVNSPSPAVGVGSVATNNLSTLTNPYVCGSTNDLFNYIQNCYKKSPNGATIIILYTISSDAFNNGIAQQVLAGIQNPASSTYALVRQYQDIYFIILDAQVQYDSNVFTDIRAFIQSLTIPVENAYGQPLTNLAREYGQAFLSSQQINILGWNDSFSAMFLANPQSLVTNDNISYMNDSAPLYFGLLHNPLYSNTVQDLNYGCIEPQNGAGVFSFPNDLSCPGFIVLNIEKHSSSDMLIPSTYDFSIVFACYLNLKIPYLILNYAKNRNNQNYVISENTMTDLTTFNTGFVDGEWGPIKSYISIIDTSLESLISLYSVNNTAQ